MFVHDKLFDYACFCLFDRDNYGFVTYYDTKDAFTAIENGGKLRRPDELPFDLCFGGRRQFCQTSYADLGRLLLPLSLICTVFLIWAEMYNK